MNGGNFMGHAIYYLDFEENVSKDKIVAEADEMAEYESDSRSGLPGTIRWLNHICDDREEAHEFIEKNDNGWYDQVYGWKIRKASHPC